MRLNWNKIMKEFHNWQDMRYERGYGTYSWDLELDTFLRKLRQLVNKEIRNKK